MSHFPRSPSPIVVLAIVNDTTNEVYKQVKVQGIKFKTKSSAILFSGLMPRLNDQNNQVKCALHYAPKPDEFHPKKALFGQNDYIDVLGNGSVRPYELLREMPWWLRGFKEGTEMHMLQRMQAVKGESWRWNRPQKWNEVQSRLDFLYRYDDFRWSNKFNQSNRFPFFFFSYMNYKRKPPQPSKF